MISSVGMSGAMSTMSASGMQRQPPPEDKDVFKAADTDGSGSVSETELESLLSGIEETTGTSIDLEEALSSYDADEDGSLSGEEMFGLMSSLGSNPGGMENGEEGEMMPPPPPPPSDQAASAYDLNSGEDDTISQLISYLQDEDYSSVEVSA